MNYIKLWFITKAQGLKLESQKMEEKKKTVEALGFYYGTTRILDFLINFKKNLIVYFLSLKNNYFG